MHTRAYAVYCTDASTSRFGPSVHMYKTGRFTFSGQQWLDMLLVPCVEANQSVTSSGILSDHSFQQVTLNSSQWCL